MRSMSARSRALPLSGRAADLGADVGGEVGFLVDAREPCADRRERVRRLAADALAGAEHDEAPAVEPQQPGIVGDGRVVGSGHAGERTWSAAIGFGDDAATGTFERMDPVDALERSPPCSSGSGRVGTRRRRSAKRPTPSATVPSTSCASSRRRVVSATCPASGRAPPGSIAQALEGEVPEYLARLEAEAAPDAGPGAPIRAALKGDLHLHSNWSDGGATIEAMARKAAELGHDYMALTDHSPSLSIAHGLDAERLETQLELVANAQRGARAVPHPQGDRGRHPRRRPPRPGRRPARRARRRRRERALEAAHERAADDRPHGGGDGQPATPTSSVTAPAAWCSARAVPSRRSTPTSCSACASTSTRRSRSTADPSGSTRRCGCSSRWWRGVQGVDRQRRARGRVSSSGSPTGAPVQPRRASPPDDIVNTWPVDRLLEWTASHA